jgi:TolB-like protein/Tfp pilus assembly protein PilF
MPSILPGYEYDIFISYRHNDNRPSAGSGGWVTEFVKALQEELAATIKEPISIYFDKNPHDGLLETHSVDKSLEGKIKCLIFIPILSQTYCDPKSFAWLHEFVAFNKLANEDQFGRDIKLSNGNVTSRILPVKIHELDAGDAATIENEIGGILRAIEFIYKEPGVNRPLKRTDNKSDNQNQTDYTNQVNKVANAIKELIHALNPVEKTFMTRLETKIENPTKRMRRLGGIIAATLVLVSLVAFLLYPKLIKNIGPDDIEKSIAILPFRNLSANADDAFFSDGMTEEITNHLSKVSGLRVMSRLSVEQYKNRETGSKIIGDELGVSNILEGSVAKSGNKFRMRLRLVRASTGFQVWSQEYDSDLTDVFKVQNDIASQVTEALRVVLSESEKSTLAEQEEVTLDAYAYYLKARNELLTFRMLEEGIPGRTTHLERAKEFFNASLSLDSGYSLAWSGLAALNYGVRSVPISNAGTEKLIQKALQLDPNNDEAHTLQGANYLAINDHENGLKELNKAVSLNPNNSIALTWLSRASFIKGNYVQSINYYSQAMERSQGEELNDVNYWGGAIFQNLGLFNEALAVYLRIGSVSGDSSSYYHLRSWLAQTQGNYKEALLYADKVCNEGYNWGCVDRKTWVLTSMGRYQDALDVFEEWGKATDESGEWSPNMSHRRGYLYAMTGDTMKAKSFITQQIRESEDQIQKGIPTAQLFYAQFDLAGCYSFLGDKEKAYYYLNQISKEGYVSPWMLEFIKHSDPLLEPIRKEERFKRLAANMQQRSDSVQLQVKAWFKANQELKARTNR